jgi:hypothetical protein
MDHIIFLHLFSTLLKTSLRLGNFFRCSLNILFRIDEQKTQFRWPNRWRPLLLEHLRRDEANGLVFGGDASPFVERDGRREKLRRWPAVIAA